MKAYISPRFGDNADPGDGGIRRVVEAQERYLPEFGVELVEDIRQADVVNAHITPNVQDARYLQQFTDVPLVVSSHGLYWAEYPWDAAWFFEANAKCMEAIRQSDVVTGPSEWVAQAIRRNSLRRAVALYHGIDAEEWTPGETEGYVLWNKTRRDPVCDPEAVSRLAALAPGRTFRTTFGGDGLPNVTVTGRLPYLQAKEEVRRAGVYLCTTRETFGIGTLEAMAAGVPVLGWRWGGQTEIIRHKETGWLAAPGDYDGLLEGLKYCLMNRAEMGEVARADVLARWSWRDAIARYVSVYEDAIRRKHRIGAPKVSVVIRAYNLAEYLPAAVQSVLAQTMTDWECVIVDDASTDSTGEVADRLSLADSGERIRVVHNVTNQHLSGAHNVGCADSRGKYIIALDADDTLTPDALQILSTALDQDRSIHIAYGNVEFREQNGETRHSGWPPAFRAEWQLRRGTGDRPPNLIPYAAMYRREVWELTGGYRRRYRNGEDADFWARATSYGFRAKMVTEADTLRYLIRSDSMSQAEPVKDWLAWYPWTREGGVAPAAIPYADQVPVPSFEPAIVSVIIPVGPGHADLLIDALDSVDAQTLRLWECIIVNDTGKPLPWVPAWAKIVTPSAEGYGPIGVGAARNIGIAAAAAKLFIPLDADDTLEPFALARMWEVYKQFGGYVYSDWYELWAGRPVKTWETKDYDARLLVKGCAHAVTALYQRKDWEQVGGFDEGVAWEDWDFQLKLADIGVCGTRIPETLFTYRKDTGRRREENISDFEKSKEGILAKWADFFEGRRDLMACQSCSGGGGGRVKPTPASTFAAAASAAPSEEFVIIEYTGDNLGTVTWRGPSKQSYNFSGLPSGRQKAVLREDAEYLNKRADFRIVELEQPVRA